MASIARADCELHYELTGGGIPLLLIQGVGVVGGGWRPQIEGLAGSFQMLTFDNRGIGRSIPCRGPVTIEAMAEDARALMDAAGWKSAHVAGHSMGGVIAQQLALDVPDRVRSLSLLCTFARAKDGARLTPWVLWMTLRTRIGTRRMRSRAFLEMLYPRDFEQFSDADTLASCTSAIVGRDLADSPPIIMKQVRALARHDCSGALGKLAGIPTQVISAEHDRIAPPQYGQRLAELIHGATFEEIHAASHGLPLQYPALINGRLRAFISEAEAQFSLSRR